MEAKLWLVASVLGVAVALGLLVWGCLKIRDRYRDDAGHADDPAMFLTVLRESARRGDVTDDEYRSIRSRLREPLRSNGPLGAVEDTQLTDSLEPGDQPPEADPRSDETAED